MTWAKLLRITERARVTAGYNGSCESAVGYDAFVAGLREAAAHDDRAQRAKLLEAHRMLRRNRPRGGRYYLYADDRGWTAGVVWSLFGGSARHADPVEAARLAVEGLRRGPWWTAAHREAETPQHLLPSRR